MIAVGVGLPLIRLMFHTLGPRWGGVGFQWQQLAFLLLLLAATTFHFHFVSISSLRKVILLRYSMITAATSRVEEM